MLLALLANLSKIPVILLGYVVVPFLWPLRKRHIGDMPKALTPWVNPEDWTGGYRMFPPAYNCVPPDLDTGRGFWTFYWYHAFRNGGDGLRNYKWHVATIVPSEMKVEMLPNGYNVRQGKYLSVFRRWGWVQVKFGWRMIPRDAEGYNRYSFRHVHGAAPTWSIRIRR